MLEFDRYIEKLVREATNNDLQLSIEKMQKYISGPATLRTMLCILRDEMEKGSRSIYSEAMEA